MACTLQHQLWYQKAFGWVEDTYTQYAHFPRSGLTLEGAPLCGAVSRFDAFWEPRSQLLMTSARSLEVSATGPLWHKKLRILELLTEKLKSNGSSDMAQPAGVEFDPFHCHWPITEPCDRSYPEAAPDQQPAGKGGWSKLQDGAAFGSYLCDAVSTRLIISLISRTRLPDGLERRSSSCLNWLQRWTWCCNYRGDWRQRLPLLIKVLTPASHIAVQWWEDSGGLPVSPVPSRPFQSLSVGSRGTQCGL